MVLIEEIIEDHSDQEQKKPKDPSPSEPKEGQEEAEISVSNEEEWIHVGHTDAETSPSTEPPGGGLESEEQSKALQNEQPRENEAIDKETLEQAEDYKQQGNAAFKAGDVEEAMEKYTLALETAPESSKDRAVYLGNRAACHVRLEHHADAIEDCNAALDIDPEYSKVWLRRATCYEALDDLEHAFSDAQKAKELDPSNTIAAAMVSRLEPIVTARREAMKEEMIGKLKELGNTVLGKFGMSLDNFKAEQDPATGSYSIKFQQ